MTRQQKQADQKEHVMGFDYGDKRIGVAVANPQAAHAEPLTTVENKKGHTNWDAIACLIQTWQPSLFVIGITGDSDSGIHRKIINFARALEKRYLRPVAFAEEAYTSTEARHRLAELRKLGLAGKLHRGDIDKIAATLILETWLLRQEAL